MRAVAEAASFNGDGQDGRVTWHRKTERGWRPDWSDVPLLSIERGGAEHRSGLQPGSGVPGGMSGNPLDRVMAAWSRDDVAAIMGSEAYRRSSHPDHVQAQALLRGWYEWRYGSPAQRDATRRIRREAPRRRGAAERAVQVRAHTREGGQERVRAHTRSWPE